MESSMIQVGEELVIGGVLLTMVAIDGDEVVFGVSYPEPSAEENLAVHEEAQRQAASSKFSPGWNRRRSPPPLS